MSLYQEFDEYAGEMKTYLYRFSKNTEDIDFLNTILNQYTNKYQGESDGKFVILKGEDIRENREKKTPGDISQIVSFLF